ncbi:unnamed protein product [Lactuca virosa]|uniref:Uncharacterized protein n=1 Tax=Lactuca virosa TaxID=75947 RepID=A0AAU9M083_9ASTR|nr:unnamed protein product [Lactuca virosa]
MSSPRHNCSNVLFLNLNLRSPTLHPHRKLKAPPHSLVHSATSLIENPSLISTLISSFASLTINSSLIL